jgi:hypothetical protein
MERLRIAAAATVLGMVATGLSGGGASAAAGADQPSIKGFIVWTDRTPSGAEQLLIAKADGTRQRVLTPAVADADDLNAQVSADGSWVAYEHDLPDTATIHLVRPDGTRDHVVDVGCVDPCVVAAEPTWLSESRIAFTLVKGPFDPVTGAAASAVLWSSRLDGSDVRRLSPPGIDGEFEDGYLHVCGDRTYVTFQRRRNSDGRRRAARSATAPRRSAG